MTVSHSTADSSRASGEAASCAVAHEDAALAEEPRSCGPRASLASHAVFEEVLHSGSNHHWRKRTSLGSPVISPASWAPS